MSNALMKRLEALEAEAGTADDDVPLILDTDDTTGLLYRPTYGGARDPGPGRDQRPGEDRDVFLDEMGAAFRPVILVTHDDASPRALD